VWIVADLVLRNNVGVRNPFAFVEAKSGKDIDWRTLSADKIRKLFETTLGASYKEIFDPHNTNSALIHPRRSAISEIRSGSGDATQCDAAIIKSLISSWGVNKLGSTYCDPAGMYGTFDDVVQGSLSDCYFMAAMCSIAFASQTKNFFPDISGASIPLTFWYNFTTNADYITYPQSSKIVKVTKDHFPRGQNQKLIFARSNTPGEIWPAIFEKGYAQFKSGATLNEPDYSKLCQGNPINALATITGYKYSTKTSVYATTTFATSPAAIYTTIAGACNPAPAGHLNDRAAKWPIVAYTYDSGDLGYSNATIVRNHSYSVLGVQKTDTDYYIVLRNPWGQVPPPVILDPPATLQDRCILDAAGNPVMCFGDPHLGTDVLSTKSWLGITDLSSPNDGIFGLKVNAFQQYFQGFGWVFS
jgi:hypothetical protein